MENTILMEFTTDKILVKTSGKLYKAVILIISLVIAYRLGSIDNSLNEITQHIKEHATTDSKVNLKTSLPDS